jgi:serine O-acetyltransferase
MDRLWDSPLAEEFLAGNSSSGGGLERPGWVPARPGQAELGAAIRTLAERVADRWISNPPVVRASGWASRFADGLLKPLFPHLSEDIPGSANDIHSQLQRILRDLAGVLTPLAPSMARPASETVQAFADALPGVYDQLWLDAEAIYAGDPAARSVDEVISAYPGFLAIAVYRIAHELSQLDVPILPRLLTEHAHQRTGIDIHPGARIGASFCIDHGTGIVIGETTIIGNHVKIYQGVTLGALSVDKSLTSSKRHPTIEDRVVIYANATILGGGTIVGHDSVIGGNVWLTGSVPPHSTVSQTSGARIRTSRASRPGPSGPSAKGAPA